MKLLIVDDSQIMQKTIQKFLGAHGLEIVGLAGDGNAALELFREHEPEVVTMDITMPEMDGMACMQEMLKLKPETKVLVITALADEMTSLTAMEKGAAGFLNKPFTSQQIQDAFDELFEEEE